MSTNPIKWTEMTVEIKICGLKTHATVGASLDAGADMVGFMFFRPSPRYVTPTLAADLAEAARGRTKIVAVVVDADDGFLGEIIDTLHPDILQLHGSETPARADEIRRMFGVDVMKALRLAVAEDLAPVPEFAPHVDRFLFDAKAPPTLAQALPGGNGIAFDWQLVAGFDAGRPAMLSGGLNSGNVAEAIRLTAARGIDVSSGVEREPGEKDPGMIRAFIAAARAAL